VSGRPGNSDQTMMRCWYSHSAGLAGLTLDLTPRPRPGPGEVLVRVEAAALNFSDLLMIDDQYQIRPARPFVPGQEIVGIVTAAGAGVSLLVGTRVMSKVTWGGFSEFALVRCELAIAVPAGTSTVTAAAMPIVYTTAMVALTHSTRIRSGETVLVLAAAGGIGLAAVQIARHLGARVIAAAGGPGKCALACAHGAHLGVDYRRSGWVDEIRALVGPDGLDVIVDPVGGNVTHEALRVIGWEGRLLVVGFSSGEIPQIPANRLLLRRAAAIGVYWSHSRDGMMLARIAGELAELLAMGAIRPHIGATFAFEQLPQALAALRGRRTTGKILLLIGDNPSP